MFNDTSFRLTRKHSFETAEKEMGKINDKMENITSGWFFLHWFQHDISMVLRNKEISYFNHKQIKV